MDIVSNPNGRQSQTVHVFKDGRPVKAAFADIELEDAVGKAKNKVDILLKSNA